VVCLNATRQLNAKCLDPSNICHVVATYRAKAIHEKVETRGTLYENYGAVTYFRENVSIELTGMLAGAYKTSLTAYFDDERKTDRDYMHYGKLATRVECSAYAEAYDKQPCMNRKRKLFCGCSHGSRPCESAQTSLAKQCCSKISWKGQLEVLLCCMTSLQYQKHQKNSAKKHRLFVV